ncbi:MAG: carbon starvation protein A [Blastocatellia bacterium]|nr:carbon starvation protein A [Blastocatellia bacterium]MBK6425501.1 carbon starvation protein A [Blastocatellia bacterium]
MTLPLLAISVVVLLVVGYRFYGSLVARQFALDDGTPTCAETHADGVDFVATRPFYLFGQHFSAIAAAGPIAGPILACQAFGWLPCLLWIGFGVVLIGAVHDFASLAASLKHGGVSIAEMTRTHLGTRAGRAVVAFIWIALVYVIIAFTDITAGTFVSGSEELAGTASSFNPGGAVAAASTMYLALALVMGLVERFLRPPLWLTTAVFVPATFAMAWVGTLVSHYFILSHTGWSLLILLYCVVASMLPVGWLLQPRGYLGGFVLYAAIGAGILGIFFGGYEIQQPAFVTWNTGALNGSLFPFLFVTIACGACSGFHGLVCSGTTSKQIAKSSHAKPIGYGAMLAEGFVALIALVTVMIVAPAALTGLAPGTIYGNSIGRFLTIIIGEQNLPFAITFGAMAFSTFVFDTIDVSTRLGRLLVQELFGWKGASGAVAGTLITVGPPAYFVLVGGPGSWSRFWTLFGASNQLLAALTLLTITVWLSKSNKRTVYTLVPTVFMFAITFWALGTLAFGNFRVASGLDVAAINGVAATVLVVLAVFVVGAAVVTVRQQRNAQL